MTQSITPPSLPLLDLRGVTRETYQSPEHVLLRMMGPLTPCPPLYQVGSAVTPEQQEVLVDLCAENDAEYEKAYTPCVHVEVPRRSAKQGSIKLRWDRHFFIAILVAILFIATVAFASKSAIFTPGNVPIR